MPKIFAFELFPVLFTFLLGFTNEFNVACAVALGPKTIRENDVSSEVELEERRAEEGGVWLSFGLVSDICLGSIVSFLVVATFTKGKV